MKNAAEHMKTVSSQIIFWSLMTGIVLLSATYIYFVQKTVWNAVAQQNTEKEIVAINSKLSDTEFQYINNVTGITMVTASELGFQPASSKVTFVTRERIGKDVAIR